jgi:hypothetical protein
MVAMSRKWPSVKILRGPAIIPTMLKKYARCVVSIASVAVVSVAIHAQSPGSAKTYKAPRTPWGDPDFQGNYTNLYEAGTPLERPEQFAGKTLSDVTPDELRAFKKKIQDDTIQRFETPFDAPSNWWQVAFKLEASAQAWLITDPDDGHVPALTAEGQARLRSARQFVYNGGSASYEDRSLYDRCITRGFPTSGMPTIYGNSSRIVQGPGFIAIQYEMIHETRVIPIDKAPRPHVSKHLRLDMGDSRGQWEGDTLVVETTNFTARSVYRNANPDTLKITERFTRVAPDKLRWTVTLDDPTTWTRPWTFAMPLTLSDAEPIQLYECHEGNYGLRNILSAARAEEREAASATKP